ncbi:MAG TPA: nuclear transport factor 2 family protein [Thermoanaerobaculia bacterium]|nr:nuclear transport factor 2 family protein [Thermoanaerobaculia bacterium]
MHPNAQIVTRFYTSFQERDAAGMAACYHPRARFSDPVFPDLDAAAAGAMWAMLCERGKDLQVELGTVVANDRVGSAHWEAWYTFSGTGRAVHNRIDARFSFEDGMILEHRDSFDLWAWSAQALGAKGRLLGWTPLVKGAVQRQAAAALASFRAKRAAGAAAAAVP